MKVNNAQNAEYTIMDLPKIIQIAREHTLLGRYETSLKKYEIALEIIQSRKKEVSVGVLKDKWQMTELNIKSEITQTKQMLEAYRALIDIDFNYFKKQIESNEIKKKNFKKKALWYLIYQMQVEILFQIKIFLVIHHSYIMIHQNKIHLVLLEEMIIMIIW